MKGLAVIRPRNAPLLVKRSLVPCWKIGDSRWRVLTTVPGLSRLALRARVLERIFRGRFGALGRALPARKLPAFLVVFWSAPLVSFDDSSSRASVTSLEST